MLLQYLEELCHAHAVLAAGDTYSDSVAFLNQFIFGDGIQKRCPESFTVCFDNGTFYFLDISEFSSHGPHPSMQYILAQNISCAFFLNIR